MQNDEVNYKASKRKFPRSNATLDSYESSINNNMPLY